MISREYNKRIDIYETTLTANQFGGHTPADALLFSSWAKVETNGVGYKVNDFGLDLFPNPVLFKCRFRNDFIWQGKTLSVKYRNKTYVIKGVKVVNVNNIEVEIYTQLLDEFS